MIWETKPMPCGWFSRPASLAGLISGFSDSTCLAMLHNCNVIVRTRHNVSTPFPTFSQKWEKLKTACICITVSHHELCDFSDLQAGADFRNRGLPQVHQRVAGGDSAGEVLRPLRRRPGILSDAKPESALPARNHRRSQRTQTGCIVAPSYRRDLSNVGLIGRF